MAESHRHSRSAAGRRPPAGARVLCLRSHFMPPALPRCLRDGVRIPIWLPAQRSSWSILRPSRFRPNITTDVTPGPLQQEAQPEPEPEKPIEKIELPPDPQAEPIVAVRHRRSPSKRRRKRKSRNRSMPALQARRPGPINRPIGRPRRCRDCRRATQMRCRTGRHSWWPSSSVPRGTHRRRAAIRGQRNSHSASTDRAACTMRVSRTAPAPAPSITKRSRWCSARSLCRRLHRKCKARKFRSSCRSATMRAERRHLEALQLDKASSVGLPIRHRSKTEASAIKVAYSGYLISASSTASCRTDPSTGWASVFLTSS